MAEQKIDVDSLLESLSLKVLEDHIFVFKALVSYPMQFFKFLKIIACMLCEYVYPFYFDWKLCTYINHRKIDDSHALNKSIKGLTMCAVLWWWIIYSERSSMWGAGRMYCI